MLLVTDYDDIQGINRLIIIVFSIGMILGSFIISILILNKIRKTEIKSSRYFLVGVSLFAFLFGVGRLILLYHDYFADNSLDTILWTLGSGITLVGLTCLTFAIEKFIFQKTKMIASVIGIICIVIVFVFPFIGQIGIAKIFLYVGNGAVIVVPFFIYLYIAKISTGALRLQAGIILTGMIVMLIANLGGNVLFTIHVLDRLGSQLFGIIIAFLGVVILSYGFVKSPNAR
ncbi:MAG TPA: hypothetical protein VKM55_21240 [Candidatus Lokiarchaeia archaeon]|nr:hypothetical protein [Candidatus Lokiarchaeia archaeon]